MKNTKVISGFPAVGKSFLFDNSKFVIIDSDSSSFSWIEKGVRNPDFPNNYIQHIRENIGVADYILVSSHDAVRKALQENNIAYTLVYPAIELKNEYIERYKNRGNDGSFISFIESKWGEFIQDIEKETFPMKIKLKSGEYLSDAIRKGRLKFITPPMNGCFCNDCVIDYFKQGLIMEGTAGWDDAIQILRERGEKI